MTIDAVRHPSGIVYQHRWLEDVRQNATRCERLRPGTRKPKSTGTLSTAACLYLRAVVERVQPRVCVEIGTFIGTSALVLASTGAMVYTCDKDNDVFHSISEVVFRFDKNNDFSRSNVQIEAFGKTNSTAMLAALALRGIRSELFFFDGRIQDEDIALIDQIALPATVFAFDDYEAGEKGVRNVRRIRAMFREHELIPPPTTVAWTPSTTTIALLVPKRWAWA